MADSDEQIGYDFKTTIDDVECGIKISDYTPAEINNVGHPDNQLPDTPEEVEFAVITVDGRTALDLEERMSEEEQDAIAEMCLQYIKKSKQQSLEDEAEARYDAMQDDAYDY